MGGPKPTIEEPSARRDSTMEVIMGLRTRLNATLRHAHAYSPRPQATLTAKRLTLVVLAAAAALTLAPIASAGAVTLTKPEKQLLALVDHARATHRLHKLSVVPSLERAARAHSHGMVDRDFFGHRSYSGGSLAARLKRFGFKVVGTSEGENIAHRRGSNGPEAAFKSWMRNPAQRAVILSKSFRVVGVGVVTGTFKGVPDVTVITLDSGVQAGSATPKPAATTSLVANVGTTNPVEAIKAARAGQTVTVAAGTFSFTTLSVPAGVTVQGAGMASTWLKGHLDFASNDTFNDLKIGDAGNSAVHNTPNTANVAFNRCHLRGGGNASSDTTAPVVALGINGSVNGVTFTGCQIERALGTENSAMSNDFNDVTIYAESGAVPQNITFNGDDIGVSNGVATGSPRMGIEATVNSGTQSWQNITVENSTIEVMDSHGLDFSDNADARSSGVTVRGCLIAGGGLARRNWGSSIDLEMPRGAVITDNTIYRGWEAAVQMTDRDAGYANPGTVFTGNTIDLTVNNGITPENGPTDLFPGTVWDASNRIIGG
jgi:uncharacterized protein YkwD